MTQSDVFVSLSRKDYDYHNRRHVLMKAQHALFICAMLHRLVVYKNVHTYYLRGTKHVAQLDNSSLSFEISRRSHQ